LVIYAGTVPTWQSPKINFASNNFNSILIATFLQRPKSWKRHIPRTNGKDGRNKIANEHTNTEITAAIKNELKERKQILEELKQKF
jgi:hypothetical protein